MCPQCALGIFFGVENCEARVHESGMREGIWLRSRAFRTVRPGIAVRGTFRLYNPVARVQDNALDTCPLLCQMTANRRREKS
jgi:hypothetical protein